MTAKLKSLLAMVLLPVPGLATTLEFQAVEPPVPLRSSEVPEFTHLERSVALKVQGCAGEVVASSFVVVPAGGAVHADTQSLTIHWTALEGADGPIDHSQMSVRVVKEWFQGGTAWSGIRADPRRVYVPELLLNNDRLVTSDLARQRNYLLLSGEKQTKQFDASEDRGARPSFAEHSLPGYLADADELGAIALGGTRFRQLWVNVTIPINAKPGRYVGRIEFDLGGTKTASGTMQIEVLPFVLAQAPLEYALYYRGKLSSRIDTISSEWKSPEQMLQEFRDIRAHQIENATIFQPDDRLDLVEQVLSLRERAGLSNSKIYYLGFSVGSERTPVDLQKMLGRVRRLMEVFKRFGANAVYFYGLDEAVADRLVGEAGVWSQVRDSGAKIFAAGKVADADFFAEHADTAVLAYAPNREVAAKIEAAGVRVLSYANPQSGPENPALFRRNYGIELWRAGYDGAMPYAYQHGFGAIYNDFDDPAYRDHVFAYPTSNGVIDTLAWEGMREAVTDVRYLATLENLVASRAASTDSDVKRAREFLQAVRLRGASDLDTMRADATTLLVRLAANHVND